MEGNLISLISNFRSTSMNEKEKKKTCRKGSIQRVQEHEINRTLA